MMQRSLTAIALATVCALAACATVVDQTTGSVTVDGRSYQTVTTELQENDKGQRYAKTVVLVAGRRVGCNPNIAGSCEDAVRKGLQVTGRPSEYNLNSNSYYALPAF